ncbi:MAG TPA: hypothetical protein VGQ27_12645, partial [Steroidobacteraceae bacterium]|nr:hypothetical protein [Steroidobacteraceae bacterium]
MNHKQICIGLAFLGSAALAQVPADKLAKPPANARHFTIQSTAGKHGDSWIWTGPDGTLMGRETLVLRGQVFELDSSGKTGADGMAAKVEIRGSTPTGDAGETFDIKAGKASWKSPVDAGSAAYQAPAFYTSLNGPIGLSAWMLETLLSRPDHSMNLLPGGKAHAEKLTTVSVGEGAKKQDITLWAITGLNNSPVPIWSDAHDKFFGFDFFLSWLPDGYADLHARLTELQNKAMAARAPA